MKKIIAAFDGLKFSDSTARYAISVAKAQGAHLVGLFLEDIGYHGYSMYELLNQEGTLHTKKKRLDRKDRQSRAKSIIQLERECLVAGVKCTIHKDRNIAIQELLKESIYADLLIISSCETMSNQPEKPPTTFIRELLMEVQCPVMLVPEKFSSIEKLVILYDGEPKSVFAIKMMSYTLSSFDYKPVQVITVVPEKNKLQLPGGKLIKELMERHYPKAEYKILKGNAETEIVNELRSDSRYTLVILGAYRRNRISRWFRPSMADILQKELKLPLFIAHH